MSCLNNYLDWGKKYLSAKTFLCLKIIALWNVRVDAVEQFHFFTIIEFINY
jgi:hypothetical protein